MQNLVDRLQDGIREELEKALDLMLQKVQETSMNLLQEGGETILPTDTLSNTMDGLLNMWEMGFVLIHHSAVEHRRVFEGRESKGFCAEVRPWEK